MIRVCAPQASLSELVLVFSWSGRRGGWVPLVKLFTSSAARRLCGALPPTTGGVAAPSGKERTLENDARPPALYEWTAALRMCTCERV